MTWRFLWAAFAYIALCVGCPDPQQPKPLPLPPEGDAGTATCASACLHMKALDCPLGRTTPRGNTCEKTCAIVREENHGAGFPVGCLTDAPSCEEAERCR